MTLFNLILIKNILDLNNLITYKKVIKRENYKKITSNQIENSLNK